MMNDRLSLMTFPLAFDLAVKKLTVTDVLNIAAAREIPTVDLMNIPEDQIPAYEAAMEKTGVSVCCYIASISFFNDRPKVYSDLQKEMDIAAALGAELFMIVPYGPMSDLKKARRLGRERVHERMAKAFSLAVKMGGRYGLRVCFETTPHDETTLSGSDDCERLLERVPGLGLVFDTANMLPHGDETLAAYEQLKKYITYVHLKDVKPVPARVKLPFFEYTADGLKMSCVVWGEGIIPVKEVCTRMCDDGYMGRFAIEYVRPKKVTLETNICQLDRFLAYLD